MFLVNSRLGLFSAAFFRRHPFSLSYGVILPSSLTMGISLILGFSPRLPVSVCGTGTSSLLAAFLASVDSAASILIFCPHHISELSTKRTSLLCLPKCLDGFYHQPALPILLCHCLVLTLKVVQEYQPVVHRLRPSSPRLRSRLTLGGRAFPRKP